MFFVSHAQRDKARPDRRLNDFMGFLLSCNLPLWIDKPEELGLNGTELAEHSLRLDGRWTEDIRTALRECTAGLGIWSVHAADRLEQDPNGVLFQELNALATSDRLFLVNFDTEAMSRLDLVSRHLAGDQQCIDLSVADPSVVTERISRLTADLTLKLGQPPRRPEVPPPLLGRPEPGPRRAKLAIDLHDALVRQGQGCRARNLAFRSFHRLSVSFQVPSHFLPDCFDRVQPGLGARIASWLQVQVNEQHKRERPGYAPVDLADDAVFKAAAALADGEGVSDIDERLYFLAMATEADSGTIQFLRRSLGAATFDQIVRVVTSERPSTIIQKTNNLGPLEA